MEPIYINGICTHYSVFPDGTILNFKTQRYLKAHLDKYGYKRVILHIEGKQKNMFVHQLVANAYLENPDNLKIINHLDNNRTNNYLYNLEWSTAKLNNDHKVKQNRHVKGEQIQTAKLTKTEVLSIRYESKSYGTSNRGLAIKYNVDIRVIWRIIKRETWKHI
jgi:hypothetical protein